MNEYSGLNSWIAIEAPKATTFEPVTADRGLYADWLYAKIVELGWHPFLRINLSGQFRPVDSSDWIPLSDTVPFTSRAWCGVV